MELLDRAGDRVSAVRAYEDFSRLVAEDLQVEPSPETKALVDAVRRRSGAIHVLEPQEDEVPPKTKPNMIAVLPFSVRGSSELSYLREGVVDLFCAKLDGAGDLRTVDPHTLLRYTQSHTTTEMDPDTARPIAERFHAGAFLLGSVVGAGGRIHVSAALYETDGTSEHRAEAETAHESEIIGVVDELVRTLLAQRITSFGGQIGRLAAMTTESMAALKAYLAGERAFRRVRCFDAILEYERAVTEDPQFALGHYRLAEARAACGMPSAAREASAAAWEERGRLAPHAHLLLEAQRSWLDGEITGAEALYRRLVGARTTDVEGWYHLGSLQFDYNIYRGRSAIEARDSLERVVSLDPTHVAAMAHLTRIAAMERRTEDVAVQVDRLLALSPTGDQALPMRSIRACLLNDAKAQRELVADLSGARAITVAATFADAALCACDIPTALEFARQIDATASPTVIGALGKVMVAHLSLACGAGDETKEALLEASSVDTDAGLEHRAFLATLPVASALADDDEALRDALREALHPPLRLYLLGLLSARLGNRDDALAHADQCEAMAVSLDETPMPRNLALGVRARVAFDERDATEALELLDQLELGPWCHLAAASPFYALANERFLRGEALLALGRPEEARGWLQGLAQRSPFELVYREAATKLLETATQEQH
jgi:TolB-like protein